MIKQISVFVENKQGRLLKLTQLYKEAGIDFQSLSIPDTTEFGILRCIVKDTDKAVKILKENNFAAKITQVIAVEVDDKPGGMCKLLEIISDNNYSVDYIYSFVRTNKNDALIVLKVKEQEELEQKLAENNIRVLNDENLF